MTLGSCYKESNAPLRSLMFFVVECIKTMTVQRLESCWPGRMVLVRLVDQDPVFGSGLLVASLVPSLGCCQ